MCEIQVVETLRKRGIPTAVYYPTPIHRQPAYRDYPAVHSLANSERFSEAVLSFPMHPYLDSSTQDRIVNEIEAALRA